MSLEAPNWNDSQDRAMYNKLFYSEKSYKDLTQEQKNFCKIMYHIEEHYSNLDGD